VNAARLFADPDRLGLRALPDADRDAAYAALSDPDRAWLKTTLALVEAVHARRPAVQTRRVCADRGFVHTRHTRPADWALFVIHPDFAAAARFAAAAMCARLAGTEPVVLLPGAPTDIQAGLLVALELTGIDCAYRPTRRPEPAALFDALAAASGADGRVLCFGADPLCLAMQAAARARCLPCWADCPPRLEIHDPAIDAARVRATHPDATDCSPLPVLYGHCPNEAPLCFGPGLEGCWLPADLSPDFFMTQRHSLTLADDDPQA
jgi:hypothetical protein